MTESNWLRQAGSLHTACLNEIGNKNGNGRLSGIQSKSLNQLQHAIGSHHGKSSPTYQEAYNSLNKMFDLVKAGNKTPPLTEG